MTEDLANKLPETDGEKLTLILTAVQSLTCRIESAESLRPLLHKVVDDISQLREGQIEIRGDITEMRGDITEMRSDITETRSDISQLREGQIEIRGDILQLKEGQIALTAEVRAIRRDVDHRFDLIYDKLVETERDHCDLHNRVTRLELNPNPPNTQT